MFLPDVKQILFCAFLILLMLVFLQRGCQRGRIHREEQREKRQEEREQKKEERHHRFDDDRRDGESEQQHFHRRWRGRRVDGVYE
jgi:flagellar biosynthesis/type III secretory pathway M-ring protein FliF/YscJ